MAPPAVTTPTTIILIRHAERDNFFMLTPRGGQRAHALVETVKNRGIAAIYSPDLARNLDTVQPLAVHLNLEIIRIPRIKAASIDAIVDQVFANHAGQVVLLVGNGSGNLRLLHQRLGGEGEGPYQYGDLFVYTIVDEKAVKIDKSRYGQ